MMTLGHASVNEVHGVAHSRLTGIKWYVAALRAGHPKALLAIQTIEVIQRRFGCVLATFSFSYNIYFPC